MKVRRRKSPFSSTTSVTPLTAAFSCSKVNFKAIFFSLPAFPDLRLLYSTMHGEKKQGGTGKSTLLTLKKKTPMTNCPAHRFFSGYRRPVKDKKIDPPPNAKRPELDRVFCSCFIFCGDRAWKRPSSPEGNPWKPRKTAPTGSGHPRVIAAFHSHIGNTCFA